MNEKTDDSIDPDPAAPPARLANAEKQLALALDALELESEDVDPDVIRETEQALTQVRDAQQLVEADRWRRSGVSRMGRPWRDEATLRELYHDQKMSTYEVADELGCAHCTIVDWMARHGIEARDRLEASIQTRLQKPASFKTERRGYEIWRTLSGGKQRKVRVHRLLAVAEFGFDAVADKVVHHGASPEGSTTPWDNRPENIELMENAEHASMHRQAKEDAAKGVSD